MACSSTAARLFVILGLFVAVTLLPADAAEDESSGSSIVADDLPKCLEGAKDATTWITIGGVSMPVGLRAGAWASSRVLNDAYEILLRDLYGYATRRLTEAPGSSIGFAGTAGCEDPQAVLDQAPCTLISPPIQHVNLEYWTSNYDASLATWPAVLPPEAIADLAGSIGWTGLEGYHLAGTTLAEARSNEVPLEYYATYNMSWSQPLRFLQPLADIDTSRLRECVRRTREGTADLLPLKDIDPDGMVEDENGDLTLECWRDVWWVAPACRHDIDSCIPVVTGGSGWNLEQMIHKAVFYDMPVALATAASWGDYVGLPHDYKMLFYWYTPDTTFADVDAQPLVFPPRDADDWAQGRKRTTAQPSGVYKHAAQLLKRAAPTADSLLRGMEISSGKQTEMMIMAERHPDGRWAGVCQWLRENQATWESWLPDAQACFEGYGPVPAADGSVTCEPCRPGWASVRVSGPSKFECQACAAGTFSAQAVATACDQCPSGQYSEENASSCLRCESGTYQPLPGMSNCTECPVGTTRFLGATAPEECECPPETFLVRGENDTKVACQDCNEYMEPCAGGDDIAMQLPGYWMSDVDFSVMRCAGEESCPGGPIGSCPDGALGPSCSECDGDFYWTGKKCSFCSDGQFFTPWLAAAGGIFLLLVTYRFGNDPMSSDLSNASQVIVLVGMAASVLFCLSVFSTTDVNWVEPLTTVFSVAEALSVDLAFFGVGCTWGSGPLGDYITYLTVPALGAGLCCLGAFTGFINKWFLFNTFCTIFYAFFIVTALLVLMPFRYTVHPSGDKTLQEVPHIHAGSAEHSSFMMVSIASLVLYLLSFVSVCTWACFNLARNPSKEKLDWSLTAFRFLFYKFKPDQFYWGLVLLIRNWMLSAVPVLSPEHPQVQIFIFILLVLITMGWTGWTKPWRKNWMNRIDVTFSSVLVLILCLGGCLTQPDEDSNAALASFLLVVSGIVGIVMIVPLAKTLYKTIWVACIASEADREASVKAKQDEDAAYRASLQEELKKFAKSQQELEQDAFDELNAMTAAGQQIQVQMNIQLAATKTVDINRLADIAGKIRKRDYRLADFRRDLIELCPEMELYVLKSSKTASSGLSNEQELERTFGALFAIYWICRLDMDGKEGFSMGVQEDRRTPQEVPAGDEFDPLELKGLSWAKMSLEQRRASFFWSFDWDLFSDLFIKAGLLFELNADQGGMTVSKRESTKERFYVDPSPDGRLVAMLVLTVIHDIMKNEALCPTVTGTPYYNFKVGDVIHDHDAALAYVIDRETHMLPSFMALTPEQQRIVRFTQSDMGFNAGWLVQAEGPPSAVLKQFKKCISNSACSPRDVAFYFCHWVTDLAGAEPTPFTGSEKFAAKFPPAVLKGLMGSFGIVEKLAEKSESGTYEDYLAMRWKKIKETLGNEPVGKDRMVRLRLQCMCQDDAGFAGVQKAWDTELDDDDKAILLAELCATGMLKQEYSTGPIPGADIANPILVYYGPAWMQRACKQTPLLALQVMAEVFRAARSKYPRQPGDREGKPITVRVEMLKKDELSWFTDRLEARRVQMQGIAGMTKENAPIFDVKVQNDFEGVLDWLVLDPACLTVDL